MDERVVEMSNGEENSTIKKNVRRCPVYLFALVGTLLIASIIVLATLFALERRQNLTQQQNYISDKISDDLCLSPFCVKTAASILESIDENVDPCDDFYQFSCGSWIRKAQIPDYTDIHDYTMILQTRLIDALAELLESPSLTSDKVNRLSPVINARRLYHSCLNESLIEEKGIDSLISLINKKFGGWPMLRSSKWNEKSFNFAQTLLHLNEYTDSILFSFGSSIHDQNSSLHSIRIGQGSLPLGDRHFYHGDSTIIEAYLNFIRDIGREFNDGDEIDSNEIKEMFQLEKKIAEFHWSTIEQRSGNLEMIYTTIGNLSSVFNGSENENFSPFDFADHLRQLYSIENVTLFDNDTVMISEFSFLRNVSQILDEESPRTVQNYLIWLFVKQQIKYLPKKFRSIRQEFQRIFSGIVNQPKRSTVCASFVNDKMGTAVAKLYLENYFDRTSRSQALEMIENIRETFIQMIDRSTWMDDESKTKAMEKARAIGQKIGYPNYFDDEESQQLNEDFEGFEFRSSFIENGLLVQQLAIRADRQFLRKPLDRTLWLGLSPTLVNAFYFASFNDMFFPAAILQPPFFHKDAPKYLNYGGIGSVIGHEITHGFDDEGRRFDKNGNKLSWWTNETIENFNQRKQCFVDQYNDYVMVEVNETVRGEQTQGENIADNGGLKQAFLAYEKWTQIRTNVDQKLPGLTHYSAEQLFFINFAQLYCVKMTDQAAKNVVLTDLHAPQRFRILGATSNLPEFDRVFRCQPGQKNSRLDKCVVW